MTTELLQIFSYNNMIAAAKIVAQKTSSGIDMIPANEAVSYVEKNYKHIINSICSGNYKPSDVLLVKIPKKGSTKKRKLAIATIIDRVVLRCIYNYLEPIYDVIFDDYSYGFRKNRNCHKALFHIMDYLYQDYRYVISLDLRDCFGNISHDRILFKLRHKRIDEDVIQLINKFLKVFYVESNTRNKNLIGCPQGNAVAPLIANVILDDLDKELRRRGVVFLRYADDVVLLAKSEKAAHRIKSSVITLLEKRLKLSVNHGKTIIKEVNDGFTMLGFFIYKAGNDIHIVPKKSAYEGIKSKIATRCNYESVNITNDIKSVVHGWISYYRIAEISSFTKTLDVVINRHLQKYQKKFGVIKDVNICCCHDFYKRKMQLYNTCCSTVSVKDGNQGNKNVANETCSNDTGPVSNGRSPPKTDT